MKGLLLLVLLRLSGLSFSQQSVAREWNNILLEAIRNDYARPTVHARNLYHHSIIVYDSWAAFDQTRQTFLLGDTFHDYICSFDGIAVPIDVQAARHAAISYASYQFIRSRYTNSPNFSQGTDSEIDFRVKLNDGTIFIDWSDRILNRIKVFSISGQLLADISPMTQNKISFPFDYPAGLYSIIFKFNDELIPYLILKD